MSKTLLLPSHIKDAVVRRFNNAHRDWLTGVGDWPCSFSLGAPTEAEVVRDLEAVRAWSQEWAQWEGPGVLEFEPRRWARLGSQNLPTRLVLQDAAQVYLNGDVEDWDLPSSPIRRLLHRLSVKSGINLTLVLPRLELSDLSLENASVLTSLKAACGVELAVGNAPAAWASGLPLATVQMGDGSCTSWAIGDPAAALPNSSWAQLDRAPLVSGPSDVPALSAAPVHLQAASSQGMHALELTSELDGLGSGFGQRFWAAVKAKGGQAILPVDRSVVAVAYSDRYLVTPISCALLVEVVSALRALYEPLDRWSVDLVTVDTMDIDPAGWRSQELWNSNWPDSALRGRALTEAFAYSGLNCQVRCGAKQQVRHRRELRVQFDRGPDLVVWLDQGLGYWSVPRQDPRISFPCSQPVTALGQQLAEIGVTVAGHPQSTLVFLRWGDVAA